MPATAVKKTRKAANKRKGVVVSKKVKDYSNDPFFVKKAKAAESFLKKHGLPPTFAR